MLVKCTASSALDVASGTSERDLESKGLERGECPFELPAGKSACAYDVISQ